MELSKKQLHAVLCALDTKLSEEEGLIEFVSYHYMGTRFRYVVEDLTLDRYTYSIGYYIELKNDMAYEKAVPLTKIATTEFAFLHCGVSDFLEEILRDARELLFLVRESRKKI